MKCVTDTNVVVSGLLWLGNPGRLLEAAAHGRVTLYTSPILVAELRSTLSYARLAKYVERSGLTLDELLTRYLNVAPTRVGRTDDHFSDAIRGLTPIQPDVHLSHDRFSWRRFSA